MKAVFYVTALYFIFSELMFPQDTFLNHFPFNVSPNKMILTSSGEYLITGEKGAESMLGFSKMFLMKTNISGDLIWFRVHGDSTVNTWAKDVIQCSDGNYIVCGGILKSNFGTRGDVFAAKFDTAGQIIWWKNYDMKYWENSYSIIPAMDNGFLIAGDCYVQDENDNPLYVMGLIIRINSDGDTLWTKRFYVDKKTQFLSMYRNSSNEIMIFGQKGNFQEDPSTSEFFTFFINENGDSLFTRTYDIEEDYVNAYSMIKSSEANYFFNGQAHDGISGRSYGHVVKIDAQGNALWDRRSIYYTQQIIQTPDNGVLNVVGYDQELKIIKYNSNGDSLYTSSKSFTGYPYCNASMLHEGNYVMAGYIQPLFGSNYMFLLKTDSEFNITDVNNDVLTELPLEFSLEQNYPNPFNPSTKIEFTIGKEEWVTLKVYNLLGEESAVLVNGYKKPGSYSVEFNADGLSSGIYYYVLNSAEFRVVRKMVLMK